MNMKLGCLLLAVLAVGVPALAQHSASEPVLDVSAMDRTVDPCVDFYAYSCGGWIKNNPIPPDQSSWDTYRKLQDENRAQLRTILEEAANVSTTRDVVTQKIGDYYASCLDEEAIEKVGAAPLARELKRIEFLKSKSDLAEFLATGQFPPSLEGGGTLFAFRSNQDFKDSTQVIAEADQGGLGLPDRDYYFKTDAKSEDLRKAYAAHVAKILQLLGDNPAQASTEAADGATHRDGAGRQPDDARGAPRPAPALSQDERGRPGETGSRIRLEDLLRKNRRAIVGDAQRSDSSLFPRHERRDRKGKSCGLEDVPPLACSA